MEFDEIKGKISKNKSNWLKIKVTFWFSSYITLLGVILWQV